MNTAQVLCAISLLLATVAAEHVYPVVGQRRATQVSLPVTAPISKVRAASGTSDTIATASIGESHVLKQQLQSAQVRPLAQVPAQQKSLQQPQQQTQESAPQPLQQRQARVGSSGNAAVTISASISDSRTVAEAYPSASPLGWWTMNTPRIHQLLHAVSFAVIVKCLCMAGNLAVQTSPFEQVKQWELMQSTGDADAAPYLSIAFGGFQWCIYGVFAFIVTGRSGFLILVYSNCLGALLGSFYVWQFYKHCRNPASRAGLQTYLAIVLTLLLFQISLAAQLPHERALFVSGCISSFCSFIGGLSMLIMAPAVIRKKDARTIPGPMVAANFLSAALWFVCGCMLADPLVAGPNLVSTLASALCIFLKLKYPGPKQDDRYDAPKPEKFPDPEIKMFAVSKKTRKAFGAKGFPQKIPVLNMAAVRKDEPEVCKSETDEPAMCKSGTGGTV